MAAILIVDADEDYCDHLYRFFNGLDHAVSLAPDFSGALSRIEAQNYDVIIVDMDLRGGSAAELLAGIKARCPQTPVIVTHADRIDVQATLGSSAPLAFRILEKPLYDAELHFQVKRALEGAALRRAGQKENDDDDTVNLHSEFIGQSPSIKKVFRMVARVAKTDASVIILGETGTGKELVAWTIHKDSLRADGPFVKVNCAALPEQLLESELFGHERGAFTGADKMRVGRFEHANGGTIFLDEVADMSLITQAKLLRVLQQKEFERLGSNTSIRTDARILSATNKNLTELMRAGLFREDLFYRLNVISIRLPPLRERKGDISLLLMYFLKRSTAKLHKRVTGFDPAAMEVLTRYSWPGNIRELENTLERAVLMAEKETIGVDNLDLMFADSPQTDPHEVQAGSPEYGSPEYGSPEDGQTARGTGHWDIILPAGGIQLAEAERQLISQALERCGGNQKKAAALLGVSGRVLNYKIMNLRREGFQDL